MGIHHFFSTLGDRLGKIFIPNQVLENIIVLKIAVILIALSLLISSLALLILAFSHHRFKKSVELIETGFQTNHILEWLVPNPIPTQLQNERR